MWLAIPLFLLFNTMLTLMPATVLGISSLAAAVVTYIFASELRQIARKDCCPGYGKDDADGGQTKKAKKRRTGITFTLTVCAITILWPLVAIIFVIFTYSTLMVAASLIAGIVGFIISVKPYSAINGHGIPATTSILASLIIAMAVCVVNPVSDLFYYGAAIINLLAVLVSLVSVISYYNVLATRKLPQFDMYKGGDDRA